MTGRAAFDLRSPLPTRPTIVEASAGTGKTFTIVGLVARYVAAGRPLDDLLVVTFTRAATAELRHRVRERLETTLAVVATVPDGAQTELRAGTDDPVVEAILAGPDAPSVVARRLRRAIADVDGAAIHTIHGFCQQALDGLSVAVGLDRDARLLDQDHQLVAGLVDDLLVRRYAAATEPPPQTRGQLQLVGKASIDHPAAIVRPDAPDVDAETEARRWLALEARDELSRRKAAGRWMSYDDLLAQLRDALADPVAGAAVAEGLRRRYGVVLVDEFQDTDPVQWDILRTAFADTPLVLVGDPKQAIYAFRGADVGTYLDAVRSVDADAVATLSTNRRADQRLLDACNHLLRDVLLGEGIAYRPVDAPAGQPRQRLHGAVPDAPLRLRVLRSDVEGLVGPPRVPTMRDLIARDVAGETTRLLAGGVTLDDEDARRRLVPGDIAVLVRTNKEAAAVQRNLLDAGVPAVINGAGSVFETSAASEWLRLLSALDRPHDEGRARSAATTALVGWSAHDVEDADDRRWQQLHDDLHDWSARLRDASPAALWRHLRITQRTAARLLSRQGGERRLTDLDHVADLLHVAATTEGRGAHALTGWLRQQIAEVEEGVAPDERTRRLESDADAVQVVTIHRSKGLEFPVVLCPSLWTQGWGGSGPPVAHVDGRRVLHVGPSGDEERDEVASAATSERAGEDLRMLYVAVTRAKHLVVAWWAPTSSSPQSPLSRLLYCRRQADDPANTRCAKGQHFKDDDRNLERLRAIAEGAGGTISVESVAAPTPPQPVPASAAPAGALEAERIPAHRVDRSWRRTSYSALTARAHASASGEHEAQVTDDEALDGAPEGSAEPLEPDAEPVAERGDEVSDLRLREVALPLGPLPGGTRAGTYVHALLEETDFAAPDLHGALAAAAAHHQARSPYTPDEESELLAGLAQALRTPLGPVADGRALRDVTRRDRLDELVFELPLAGGDQPRGAVTVARIAEVLRDHADGDPLLTAYLDGLALRDLSEQVRGYLTGSIDLVLRVRAQPDRFVVVDYKTNRLGRSLHPGEDAEATAWDYRPAALTDAMCRGHYPLQALLYVVALHRYLRWRLGRRYNAAAHLGGAAYLFVRGMVGPDTPQVDGTPTGVAVWRPAVPLVEAVSTLLDTGGLRDG